jgi:hypothetical protein
LMTKKTNFFKPMANHCADLNTSSDPDSDQDFIIDHGKSYQ